MAFRKPAPASRRTRKPQDRVSRVRTTLPTHTNSTFFDFCWSADAFTPLIYWIFLADVRVAHCFKLGLQERSLSSWGMADNLVPEPTRTPGGIGAICCIVGAVREPPGEPAAHIHTDGRLRVRRLSTRSAGACTAAGRTGRFPNRPNAGTNEKRTTHNRGPKMTNSMRIHPSTLVTRRGIRVEVAA